MKIVITLLFLFVIAVTAGCIADPFIAGGKTIVSTGSDFTDNQCKQACSNPRAIVPLYCSCPAKTTPTPTTPGASVQISGKVGSWDVDVTNLGTTTTSYLVTINYLDKDVILSSESKETPVIAPGENGRVKFFGDGVGAYSIKVKSITLKDGGNVGFTITDQ